MALRSGSIKVAHVPGRSKVQVFTAGGGATSAVCWQVQQLDEARSRGGKKRQLLQVRGAGRPPRPGSRQAAGAPSAFHGLPDGDSKQWVLPEAQLHVFVNSTFLSLRSLFWDRKGSTGYREGPGRQAQPITALLRSKEQVGPGVQRAGQDKEK